MNDEENPLVFRYNQDSYHMINLHSDYVSDGYIKVKVRHDVTYTEVEQWLRTYHDGGCSIAIHPSEFFTPDVWYVKNENRLLEAFILTWT